MKICFISPFNSIHIEKWINYFYHKQYKTILITDSEIINNNIKAECFYLKKKKSKINFWFNIIRTFFLLKKINPGIIHFHYIFGISWVSFLLKKNSFIITVWGGDILSEQGALTTALSNIIVKKSLKKAKFVTVHSNYLKNRLIQLGVNRNKIKFISFGVDLDLFKKKKINKLELKLPKIKKGVKVLLSIRIPRKEYNIDRIIKSFEKVTKIYPNIILLIKKYCSDKNYLKYLDNLIYNKKLEKKIIFINETAYKKIPNLYNFSDLVISLPDSDGLPISVLETMACGVVPIMSNLKEYKDDFINNVNAVFVKHNNISDISKKIIDTLSNNKIKKRIINNNLKYVKKHDFKKNMKKMEKLLV